MDNKTYNFVADKIEVRGSLLDTPNPTYIVKGYAQIPNKPDIYKYQKRPDGSYKTFKSMFTDNCIKSIKRQAKHKKVFVDSQHELSINANIKSILKDKLNPNDFGKVESFLKAKTLPFSKLYDIDIDDNGLLVDTRPNPAFRNVDEAHRQYFDSVWSSLENHYLTGISTNFANPKIIKNENGIDVIDDLDILGFSYVDGQALPENNIFEVAIRSMIETRQGENMAEEEIKKKEEEIKQEKEKVEAEKKALDEEKAKIAKDKEDAEKSDLEKQKEEQKKTQEDLDKKMEDLKKREEALGKGQGTETGSKSSGQEGTPPAKTGKSVVQQQDKYGQAEQPPKQKYDEKFYTEKVAEITKEHDESVKAKGESFVDNRMKGFGEMVNLAAKSRNPILGLDDANKRFIEDNPALLSKGGADIVAPR